MDSEAQVLDFVKESTKQFDSSHNHEHAWKVYQNTKEIMNASGTAYDHNLMMYSALLHDVCDHKYSNSISFDKLEEYIVQNLGKEQAKDVITIINNVSFSKEDKVRKGLAQAEEIADHLLPYLISLRDGDRLEAIGQIGIERCIEYSKAIGRKIPEDVIEHCHEKLLRLYEEKFIVTEHGRKMAEPLHQEIVDYVKEYENKQRVV